MKLKHVFKTLFFLLPSAFLGFRNRPRSHGDSSCFHYPPKLRLGLAAAGTPIVGDSEPGLGTGAEPIKLIPAPPKSPTCCPT